MSITEKLQSLCYKEGGALKTKPECRSVMINELILGEASMDIDAAEDLADKTLRELNLWGDHPVAEPEPEPLP